MNEIAQRSALPAMSEDSVAKVTQLAMESAKRPQIPLKTQHVFHAGVYARTITLPANAILTGVLVKIPTLVIVSGSCKVYTGATVLELNGYNVLPAGAGRKQAYRTNSETSITLMFATTAKTVEEAEAEFTDEGSSLMSRSYENDIIFTGE